MLRSLKSKLGHTARLAPSDPITQLILGIFSRDLPENKARDVLDRLQAMVVDYNELRVIAPIELTEVVGDISDARIKCEDLSRALNRIFAAEHTVSLDHLLDAPVGEINAYLDQVDGLEPYTRARIKLLGFKRHAIPLDEAMLAYVRANGMVPAKYGHKEAQEFLARRIPEKEALASVALLKKAAWAEVGALVRKQEVERILSVPPDRTSRNMLRAVASAAEGAAAPDESLAFDEASGEALDAEVPAGVHGGDGAARSEPRAAKRRPRSRSAQPKQLASVRKSSGDKPRKPKSAARSRS